MCLYDPIVLFYALNTKQFHKAFNITFKPISVQTFIGFGLFGDTIFDVTGNIMFTEDNASNALK